MSDTQYERKAANPLSLKTLVTTNLCELSGLCVPSSFDVTLRRDHPAHGAVVER